MHFYIEILFLYVFGFGKFFFSLKLFSWIDLIKMICFNFLEEIFCLNFNRVKLSDVDTLVLNKGEYTTARRTQSILQVI